MIKKVLCSTLVLLFLSGSIYAQDKKAYQLYKANGSPVNYSQMLDEIEKADFVFFGELHNNAIAHWLELEVTKDLFVKNGNNLILAAEMFEADNQLIIDEYLTGLISTSRFEAECRLWPNYKYDYQPLVEFAKSNELKFVASNIPRRYASLVSTKGFEGLDSVSAEAKAYFPPLPFPYDPEVPCYRDMMNMMGGPGGHANENLPKAQAAKDAAMAYFSLRYFESGKQVLHYNGSYHSQNKQGIIWYLNQFRPGLDVQVIHTVTQKDIYLLEDDNKGLGDFILVVDEDVTTTY